ncbi:hypothetical protein HC167_12265 [Aeromonas media]
MSYSYTLSGTIDNDSKAGATGTGFDDSITIGVNGVGGTSASDQLIVRIVDDVPTAANDAGGTLTEDVAGSLNGNVLSNDAGGADTPAVFVGWSASGHDNGAAVAALNSYGTFTQDPVTGAWTYVLDNSKAATQALTAGSNLSYDVWYTMKDADGDESIAKLTINIKGVDDSSSVVTAAATGAGPSGVRVGPQSGRVQCGGQHGDGERQLHGLGHGRDFECGDRGNHLHPGAAARVQRQSDRQHGRGRPDAAELRGDGQWRDGELQLHPERYHRQRQQGGCNGHRV